MLVRELMAQLSQYHQSQYVTVLCQQPNGDRHQLIIQGLEEFRGNWDHDGTRMKLVGVLVDKDNATVNQILGVGNGLPD